MKFRSKCKESVTISCFRWVWSEAVVLLKKQVFSFHFLDLGFKIWLLLLFSYYDVVEVKKQSLSPATLTRDLLLSSPNTAF